MGKAKFAVMVAVFAALLTTAAAQTPYDVVSLGPGVVATDINNRLQVVGYEAATGELLTWDWSGRHATGVRIDPTAGLRINDGGIIAGVRVADGDRRVFALVNGAVYHLPSLPDTVYQIRALTNINTLLVQGPRGSWLFADGTWTNLTAITGAQIRTMNDAGTMGGATFVRSFLLNPYLRSPDGSTVIPWTGAPGVEVVGSAGHFASSGFGTGAIPYWWSGTPEGEVTRIAETSVFLRLYEPLDINLAGDVVGYGQWARSNPLEPWYSVGFVRRHGVTAWLPLERAVAINDAGYIVGIASGGAVVLVPGVSPPAGLTFTVTNRVVTLSWQPTPGALDYRVEAGTVSGAADLYNASVGAQPGLVTPAPPGRYYVRVRARTPTGITPPSQEVVLDVP